MLLAWLLVATTAVRPADAARAREHYRVARGYMAEAKASRNAMRLAYLGWVIGDELEAAVVLDPSLLDARLDLIRYYTMTPRIVGGNLKKARTQAAEIAKRDPALGAWATGYIAYRQKEYGPARRKLQQAVRDARDPQSKALALTWLGYLSQETQQYDDAFRAWQQLLETDPARIDALYEIGRTAVFARRELDRGANALEQYLAGKPTPDMPSLAEGHWQLGLVEEKRGNRDAARRELETALKLDPDLRGAEDALERIGQR